MRIAQVAPATELVPPVRYGGVGRVVSYLTEALVELGHEVTLFAQPGSRTKARLAPLSASGNVDGLVRDLLRARAELDVIHFQTTAALACSAVWRRHPSLATLHWQLHLPGVADALAHARDLPLVSASNHQRQPAQRANWLGTVPYGLPLDLYSPVSTPGKYLAFLGRICPGKGIEQAIEVAVRSGVPLKVAATVYPEDAAYFQGTVLGLIERAAPLVEFLGEVDDHAKQELLGNALALLFLITWDEPFGLVMVESLACGTPVIATDRGSVPEVVDTPAAGVLVTDVAGAVRAVHDISRLDRRACREVFEQRFSASRMARDYASLYQRVLEQGAPAHVRANP
jgi:glycosyltransferase involved in cell wall biosynthesis